MTDRAIQPFAQEAFVGAPAALPVPFRGPLCEKMLSGESRQAQQEKDESETREPKPIARAAKVIHETA